ncbi:hypothetical protein GCM10027051_33160 [Niabella terrae]
MLRFFIVERLGILLLRWFCCLAGVFFIGYAHGQDPIADSAKAVSVTQDSLPKKNTLTLAALYSNNASYYGQTAAEKMPYLAVAGVYSLKSGIYFSAMGYRLLKDSGRVISAAAAGVGVNFPIAHKLTMDLSYTHTFYPEHSAFLQASNPDLLSATLEYEHWLTTGLNFDYAFGSDQDMFVTLSNAKQINLASIGKHDVLTLTPAIDIVAGTQRFYETYVTEKRRRDSLLGLPLNPLSDLPGQGQNQEETTTTKSSTGFNLLSYNFKIPLAYNRASYMIELAYQLSVLSKELKSNSKSPNSIFTLGFYYQF